MFGFVSRLSRFVTHAFVVIALAVLIAIGAGFAYLGFTGTWDTMSVLTSLMGLLAAVALVSEYIAPWIVAAYWWWQDAKREAVQARVVVPTWSLGHPEFDPHAPSEENPTDPFEERREEADQSDADSDDMAMLFEQVNALTVAVENLEEALKNHIKFTHNVRDRIWLWIENHEDDHKDQSGDNSNESPDDWRL